MAFEIEISPLTPGAREIPKAEVFPLLPAGSKWKPAAGWRSFFGIPHPRRQPEWLALGVHGDVKHAQGGAYPISTFALTKLDQLPFEGLSGLAESIQPDDALQEYEWTYGVEASASKTPEEHRSMEAQVLRRAASAYRQGRQVFFRTALLSRHEIPGVREHRSGLVVTVPHVCSGFAPWDALKLELLSRLG